MRISNFTYGLQNRSLCFRKVNLLLLFYLLIYFNLELKEILTPLKVSIHWFWNQCEPVQNRTTSVLHTRGCQSLQSIPHWTIAIPLTWAALWKFTHV